VLSWAGNATLAFRIDYQLVLALVDGVLGRAESIEENTSASGTGAAPSLTPTETRIVSNIFRRALSTLTPQVFNRFVGTRVDPPLIRPREASGLVPETLDPAEMIVALSSQYSINGRSGGIAVGLILTSIVARRTQCAPPPGAQVAADGIQRARATLASARLTLAAVLGSVKLPLTGVEALTCGSVIPLRRLSGRSPTVELRAGEQILFAGTVIAERGWYRFLIRDGEEAFERTDSSI
jgi:flagellar motor switch protein FliM